MANTEEQAERQARIQADIRRLFARYRVARPESGVQARTDGARGSMPASAGRFRAPSKPTEDDPGSQQIESAAQERHV